MRNWGCQSVKRGLSWRVAFQIRSRQDKEKWVSTVSLTDSVRKNPNCRAFFIQLFTDLNINSIMRRVIRHKFRLAYLMVRIFAMDIDLVA